MDENRFTVNLVDFGKKNVNQSEKIKLKIKKKIIGRQEVITRKDIFEIPPKLVEDRLYSYLVLVKETEKLSDCLGWQELYKVLGPILHCTYSNVPKKVFLTQYGTDIVEFIRRMHWKHHLETPSSTLLPLDEGKVFFNIVFFCNLIKYLFHIY